MTCAAVRDCSILFKLFKKNCFLIQLFIDQDLYDKEINRIQKGLKTKVNKLYDAENKSELKGFNLVALSKDDKDSLKELIGD